MVELSLIKLPSRNCLRINVTGTYWKEIQHTILSCNRTVVADPSAISRQSVGDQLGSDRQPIGDRSATGWRLYLERLFLIAESLQFLEICRQPIGDWSAISRRLKTVSECLQPLQLVGDQSPTSRRPVGNLSATTKNLSTIDLVAERFHLQQPKTSLRQNRPCNHLQPVGDQSSTSLQPPCNLPATTRNFGRKEVADRLQANICFRPGNPICKIYLLLSSALVTFSPKLVRNNCLSS